MYIFFIFWKLTKWYRFVAYLWDDHCNITCIKSWGKKFAKVCCTRLLSVCQGYKDVVYLVFLLLALSVSCRCSMLTVTLMSPVAEWCRMERSGFLPVSSAVGDTGTVTDEGVAWRLWSLTTGLAAMSDLRRERCSTSFTNEPSDTLFWLFTFLPYNSHQQQNIRVRTILVLGYWVLGNIHRYWVVLLLGDILLLFWHPIQYQSDSSQHCPHASERLFSSTCDLYLTDAVICLDTMLICYCLLNTVIVIIIELRDFSCSLICYTLVSVLVLGIGIASGQYYWVLDIGCFSWYRSNLTKHQ